jgi:hypothetical protein
LGCSIQSLTRHASNVITDCFYTAIATQLHADLQLLNKLDRSCEYKPLNWELKLKIKLLPLLLTRSLRNLQKTCK